MNKLALLLAVGCLMAAGLKAQLQDTLTYSIQSNLAYLPLEQMEVDSLQRLNLLIPNGVESPPLLVWVGGGAWSFVNRHQEMDLARKFARAGIAVASVGHRLSKGTFSEKGKAEGVQHPAHIEDLAAAFYWLVEQADKFGYDPENIFVGGFSSGAHLTALLAMDERYLAKYKLQTSSIRGMLPVAGTYDIPAYYDVFVTHENPEIQTYADTHVKDVFGPEDGFVAASPATYLDSLEMPMLLISEGALFEYTQSFEQQIWESDYRNCQILHVLHLGHGGLWRNISRAPNSQTRKVMIDFIERNSEVNENVK